MSTPKNPLSDLTNYRITYSLVAFPSIEAASNANIGILNDKNIHRVGTSLSFGSCEDGIIVVNDIVDQKYLIQTLEWKFDWCSPLNRSTTASYGNVTIIDRPGGFFLEELKNVSDRLDRSLSHIGWSLTAVLTGEKSDGSRIVFKSKPLIFNVLDITYTIGQSPVAPLYQLYFVMAYNTTAQLDPLSNLTQTTITHKDSSLSNEIPPALGATGGIMLRSAEDGIKKPARKIRQDKSKPMKTLKDVFDGFEKELTEHRFEHKRQLQEWLAKVKNGYSYKISPPKQKKEGGKPLPFEFYFDVSDYSGYEVNNRNLYFEQPEQSQTLAGIRSITIPLDYSTYETIDKIMRYSKKVGEEALSGKNYKINAAFYTTCFTPKCKIMYRVRKIDNPFNKQDIKDTGPGEGAVNPLTFTLHEGKTENPDVISIVGYNTTDVEYLVHEDVLNDPDATAIMGDREQITLERSPETPFFRTAFSGKRFNVSADNFMMEDGAKSAAIDYENYINSVLQNSSMSMKIVGNIDLWNDIARNPYKTYFADDDSPAYYRFPEHFPMYVKLEIQVKNNAVLGQIVPENEPPFFYHTYYYHISSITNRLTGGTFVQELRLLRKDNYA